MTSLKTIQCLHILMLLPLAFLGAEGWVCGRWWCASIRCINVQCSDGFKITQTECGCCPSCVQTLDEGSACSPKPTATFHANGSYSVSDAPHPPVCKDGLFCANGVCKAVMSCDANGCASRRTDLQCASTLDCAEGFKSVPNADDCGCCSKCVPTLDEGSRCFSGIYKTVYANGVYTWRDYQTVCDNGLECATGHPYPMCKAIYPGTLCEANACHTVSCADALSCQPGFMPAQGRYGCGCCRQCLEILENCAYRREVVLDISRLLGQYVPQCKEDGSYRAKQCGPGPVCHCVNEQNVRIGQYSAHVWVAHYMTCLCAREKEQNGAMICTEQGNHYENCSYVRQQILDRGQRIGEYLPQCNEYGSYTAKQCGPGPECHCVNEQNMRIGTYSAQVWEALNMTCLCAREKEQDSTIACTELGNHYESCAHRRDVAHAKGVIPGQYVPQCNDDGSYKAKQCGPGSVCRCVNEQHKQIGQYIVPIGKAADMTCLCARQQELVQDVSFRCTELGNFNTFSGVYFTSGGALPRVTMTSLLLFVACLRLLFL